MRTPSGRGQELSETKDKQIRLFCELAKKYELVWLRNSETANKVSKEMGDVSQAILSKPGGLALLFGLVRSRNVFIAGWSSMNILSFGDPSSKERNDCVKRLKAIREKGSPLSSIVRVYLAANGHDKLF